MDEILAAVRAVLAVPGYTDEQFVTALQRIAKPVHQLIFDDGHGVATATQQTKIDRLTADLERVTGERDQAKTELTNLRSKTPDVEAVRLELQGQIDAKDKEIEGLQTQLKTEKQDWQKGLVLSKLQGYLAKHLNDGYEEILVERRSTQELISFTDDGKPQILRPGKATPFSGDEEAQIEALGNELLKTVKDVYKRSDVKPGSGTEGAAGGGGQGKADYYQRVAEDAKKETGSAAGFKNPEEELARRLGQGRVRTGAGA